MRKVTVEKIEPFANAMLNYLKTAPVSELITRARGDYVFLKLEVDPMIQTAIGFF